MRPLYKWGANKNEKNFAILICVSIYAKVSTYKLQTKKALN